MARCREVVKASRVKATWRVAEDSTSRQSVLITLWNDSITFHSWNPRHPLGLWLSDHQSIVLVILVPMMCVFLCSYLLIFVIQPTFIPIFIQPLSVRPTSTPSLIHPYLIYGVIAIRLDHSCDKIRLSCTIVVPLPCHRLGMSLDSHTHMTRTL